MQPRFGTDGLRGVADTELTPALVFALGRVAARQFPGESFLIGRDTRLSSPTLGAALGAGIVAEGGMFTDIGVIPTPGLAYVAALRRQPAAMISASHNPYYDNGIKLLSTSGTKLDGQTEQAIERELDALLAASNDADSLVIDDAREDKVDEGANAAYVDHLLRSATLPTGYPLRVVCDCANGASSFLALEVFQRFGVDVAVICADPDGVNINEACGSTHPELLAAEVVSSGADVGLCFDGDADRVIAVGHDGTIIDGDRLLAMFALDLAERGELVNSGIAVTVLANLGLHRRLAEAGINVVETPVGDRYVADAIVEHGFVLGGEQSGHIIFRREATTGDGMLTGLKLLELIARRREPLSALAAASMTRLPQVLRAVPVTDPKRLKDASAVWSKAEEYRLSLGNTGRVLIRGSGTEAAVRVMVEAETSDQASAIAEDLVALVEHELGA